MGEAVTLGRKQPAANPKRTMAYDPRPLADWCVPVVYEALFTPRFPARDARRSLAATIAGDWKQLPASSKSRTARLGDCLCHHS